MWKRIVLMMAAVFVFSPAAAMVHPEGVVRLSALEIEAGSALGLRGEKLPKVATMKLELRGARWSRFRSPI